MLVKFANAEVEVWKLRQGVVLGQNSNFVHIVSFQEEKGEVIVQVEFHNNYFGNYYAWQLEWLEPS